jgi:hypothetical protein
MMDGWYKMHRKIIESPIFNNPNALRMWVWMLAKASHKQCSLMVGNQEVTLMPGEFVFGRAMASAELSIPKSTVYDMLKSIEKMGMIRVKSGNKFSIVTVVNWGIYQGSDNHSSATSRQQTDNKSATSRQQTDTNKNVKNNKECKEEKEIKASPDSSFSSDDWRVKASR